MLSAAKNGSESQIVHMCYCLRFMPVAHVDEAVTILCSVLDVPAFPPDQPLPSSLTSIRSLAFTSLHGLSDIPVSVWSTGTFSSRLIVMQNWSRICNWIYYFLNELDHSPSLKTVNGVAPHILTSALGLLKNITHFDEDLKRLTFDGDDLLNLLVKVWLNFDICSSAPFTALMAAMTTDRWHRYVGMVFPIISFRSLMMRCSKGRPKERIWDATRRNPNLRRVVTQCCPFCTQMLKKSNRRAGPIILRDCSFERICDRVALATSSHMNESSWARRGTRSSSSKLLKIMAAIDSDSKVDPVRTKVRKIIICNEPTMTSGFCLHASSGCRIL